MFLIFSLRRPDILPYTDLGVQKGLLRFALTAHNAFPGTKGKFQLKKKDNVKTEPSTPEQFTIQGERATPPPQAPSGVPPTPLTPSNTTCLVTKETIHTPNSPGNGSIKPVLPPTPFTPGQETLQVHKADLPQPAPVDLLEPVPSPHWDPNRVAPLGAGLTVETMKSRWSGKKAK